MLNQPLIKEYRNEKDNSILILIPAGEFIMGTADDDIEYILKTYPETRREWFDPERPQRKVYLQNYYIGKYEVTNDQFKKFINESGYKAQGNWHDYSNAGRDKHPVAGVTWYDAEAYCKWAGLQLPSDAEWEKAARGTDGRMYPWGSKWDKNLCNNLTADMSDLVNSRTPGIECKTIPTGIIPGSASPFGVFDMAGNVWEWCDNSSRKPANIYSGESNLEEKNRIVRGGSWHGNTPFPFRCTSRLSRPANEASIYTGFRCSLRIGDNI